MKELRFKAHSRSEKIWRDSTDNEIPKSYISKYDKNKELIVGRIIKKALFLNQKLEEFKEAAFEEAEELHEELLHQNKLEGKKGTIGNVSFYTFDRSAKIEINLHHSIKFDEALIEIAKRKLMIFFNDSITAKNAAIKQLVVDAFETRKGQLDPKKVMGLLKYRTRIKDNRFSESCDLIEESINRTYSKKYMHIYIRDEHGDYQNVSLNFSSI